MTPAKRPVLTFGSGMAHADESAPQIMYLLKELFRVFVHMRKHVSHTSIHRPEEQWRRKGTSN